MTVRAGPRRSTDSIQDTVSLMSRGDMSILRQSIHLTTNMQDDGESVLI